MFRKLHQLQETLSLKAFATLLLEKGIRHSQLMRGCGRRRIIHWLRHRPTALLRLWLARLLRQILGLRSLKRLLRLRVRTLLLS
jgi:hypothetical protein